MIMCLIGTNPYDFTRLVKEVDFIAARSKLDIFVQIGNTTYLPKNCKYSKFLPRDEVYKLIESSELVITQGGFGSMTDAILQQKPLIAVPRSKDLKEAQDNQQELVQYFESKGYLKACYDVSKLENLIADTLAGNFHFNAYKPESESKASDLLCSFISQHI